MTVYRQGDVLLRKVRGTGSGTSVERDRGRIVLAYGEVTGHAHAIASPDADLLQDTETRFLRVLADAGVDLSHEEHGTITLPKGTYEVIGQYEHQPWGFRQVAD